jgi:hypothetical protein
MERRRAYRSMGGFPLSPAHGEGRTVVLSGGITTPFPHLLQARLIANLVHLPFLFFMISSPLLPSEEPIRTVTCT